MLLIHLLALLAVPQTQTDSAAQKVANAPLEDANIKKREIPPALQDAVNDPYPSGLRRCSAIKANLDTLDEALGPDLDGTKPGKKSTGQVATSVARGAVRSLIPFREVVREISGAAGDQRRYDRAVDAGMARRGYLRGLAIARGCAR